jgi:hypothetical protein
MTFASIGAVLCLCAALISSGVAQANPPSCRQYDALGFCVVEAQQGGSNPASSSDGRSLTGPGGATPACTLTSTGDVVPCQDGAAWWVPSMQCYVRMMAEQPPASSVLWGGHSDGAIYECTFYSDGPAFPGTNGFSFWSATAPAGPVDPGVLAQQALRTLTVPAPTTGRYPAGTMQDGQPFTVVNAYTWFWTDPGSLLIATWVCRSGSPARESRWVNAAAIRPRTSTCATP